LDLFAGGQWCSSLWQACQPGSGKKGEEDRLLAKVYNKSLYLSDLEGMIPASSSSGRQFRDHQRLS
jgi:hypothetical protein